MENFIKTLESRGFAVIQNGDAWLTHRRTENRSLKGIAGPPDESLIAILMDNEITFVHVEEISIEQVEVTGY